MLEVRQWLYPSKDQQDYVSVLESLLLVPTPFPHQDKKRDRLRRADDMDVPVVDIKIHDRNLSSVIANFRYWNGEWALPQLINSVKSHFRSTACTV